MQSESMIFSLLNRWSLTVSMVVVVLLVGCGGGGGGGGGSGLELDSGGIAPAGTFSHTFMTVGTFNYHCTVTGHDMTGTVNVQALPMGVDKTVSIVPGAKTLVANAYIPDSVTVGIGEAVTWTNNDGIAHTVTSQ